MGKALPDLKNNCDHNNFSCISSCCKSSIEDHHEKIVEVVNQHMDLRVAEIYGKIDEIIQNFNRNQN